MMRYAYAHEEYMRRLHVLLQGAIPSDVGPPVQAGNLVCWQCRANPRRTLQQLVCNRSVKWARRELGDISHDI